MTHYVAYMRCVFLLLALFFSSTAYTKSFSYDVIIDAPKSIQVLLEDNLEIVRWRDNERVDRALLRQLYRNTPDEIRKLMETEGYYSPEIESRIDRDGDVWKVSFQVKTGPQTKVSHVDLIFEGAITSQEASVRPGIAELEKNWALPVGSVFRQSEWEAAKIDLLRRISNIRYPRAQIRDTQATVNPENNEVTLKVVVDSGSLVKFGAVNIVGLDRYQADAIMREKPVKEGSVFRESALLNWQTRLQNTGLFSSVDVSANLESDQDDVPVTVTVVENKRKHVGAGVGFDTDTGKRMSLVYDDLQFLGRDLRMKSALTLDSRRQTARADIHLPNTSDGFRHSMGGKFERSDIEGEDIRLASIYGRRTWGTPRLESSLTLEYMNENTRIDGVGNSHSQAMPLTFEIIKRQLNNRLMPTRGYTLQAQVGVAVEPVLTDKSFIRTYLRGVGFLPVGEKGNLIVRGEFGAVLSSDKDGVPSTILFRTGGAQSVRGYAYESLGVDKGNAVVGGRYLATGSIEYQYYFVREWGAAVFVDAGNAGDSLSALNPVYGYGVGGRWRSPVGPVGIDVAYGEKTQEVRVHFSLGFTF